MDAKLVESDSITPSFASLKATAQDWNRIEFGIACTTLGNILCSLHPDPDPAGEYRRFVSKHEPAALVVERRILQRCLAKSRTPEYQLVGSAVWGPVLRMALPSTTRTQSAMLEGQTLQKALNQEEADKLSRHDKEKADNTKKVEEVKKIPLAGAPPSTKQKFSEESAQREREEFSDGETLARTQCKFQEYQMRQQIANQWIKFWLSVARRGRAASRIQRVFREWNERNVTLARQLQSLSPRIITPVIVEALNAVRALEKTKDLKEWFQQTINTLRHNYWRNSAGLYIVLNRVLTDNRPLVLHILPEYLRLRRGLMRYIDDAVKNLKKLAKKGETKTSRRSQRRTKEARNSQKARNGQKARNSQKARNGQKARNSQKARNGQKARNSQRHH